MLRNHGWSRHERESWRCICLFRFFFFFLFNRKFLLTFWSLCRCHKSKSIGWSSCTYLLCWSLCFYWSRWLYEMESRWRRCSLSFISITSLWLWQESKARSNRCFLVFLWLLLVNLLFNLFTWFLLAVAKVVYYFICFSSAYSILWYSFNLDIVVSSSLIIKFNSTSWYKWRIVYLIWFLNVGSTLFILFLISFFWTFWLSYLLNFFFNWFGFFIGLII